MTKPFHLPLGSRSYLRAGMRTSALIVGSLSCFAAFAQTYPVSGVWVATDHQFPQSKAGACFTLRTIGVDALVGGSFPMVMIFSDGQRFVVREGRPTELAIRSVDSVKDGGFRITESLGKHGGWLPWFKHRQFHLKIVDPMLIEIADGPVSTRFFKCSSDRTPL
jgi:hypothetical protein